MKLPLMDFQRIGAVFVPSGIDKKRKSSLLLCGQLIFPDQDTYYVKVKPGKRGGFPVIVKVCNVNKDLACIKLHCLMERLDKAMDDDVNNIRKLMFYRRANLSAWWFLFALCICTAINAVISLPNGVIRIGVLLVTVIVGCFMLVRKGAMIRHGLFRLEVC